MSLINDALRRASQTEKNRPRRSPPPMGMEPTPAIRSSRLSLLLVGTMLLSLLLACWCFWQWWMMRHEAGSTRVANVAVAPAVPRVVAPPVVTPKPVSAPIAPVTLAAPVVSVKPAPVPVAAAPVMPAVSQHVAPPPELPAVSNFSQSPWPVDIKLNAIFFSKAKPRALINGDMYGIGDDIQGVVLKKIEKDKVTLEWNGHTRVLTMEGK